jgi:3-hydroxyacyl-[acyl-carrier-protein] dehydratase
MLKNSFYTVTSLTHLDNTIVVGIEFNAGHDIFTGHFPGQPMAPGACLLQMVKEVLCDTLSTAYRLKIASNLKFIAPVDPRMVDEAELKMIYKTVDAGLQVTGTLNTNGVVCFKMQAVFIRVVSMNITNQPA